MRIVHTESSCGWGGQELRILAETQGLAARGHELALIAPPQAPILRAAKKRGIAAFALAIDRKGLRGVFSLRRWLIEHPVDLLATHSSTDSWLAALACATLAEPPPLVRTRHISAPVPNDPATRWLYLRATRRVVTTGESTRQALLGRNRFPPEHVVSIPTGVDAQRFAPGDRAAARRALGLSLERRLVGIVATLRSWKGHRYLIEALVQLPPDVDLVIVGDGPQRGALEAQVAALGLPERVRFAGEQEDVLPWLRAFDVFALPSYANEGVPQALVQAMLVGLACVTTNAGSIGEAAHDGETALVVRPGDVGDLERALRRLLEEAELRARLGARAREHCARRFDLERMLDRVEALYREVAGV